MNIAKPIYLDYAATTPVDQRVAVIMQHYLTQDEIFGNPTSRHFYGREANRAVEEAREHVAHYLQAHPSEIILTSGATESNNLALKGAAHLYQRKGKHIVTMKTEHKSVLDTCQHLEKEGYSVTYLTPQADGKINLNRFEEVLRQDTILVSVMHVNNETGVIQNIAAIADITAQRGILFHVDAAQSIGKLLLSTRHILADLISVSAHKVYGPKGIGALYLRKKPRVRVEPLIHGGGHEQGMRSGTLATHQIVGMGEAFRIARDEIEQDEKIITNLRNQFLQELRHIKNFKLNSKLDCTVPHILNLCFENMLADVILEKLPNIATSTASACQGKGVEGSYVLRAMGLNDEQVKSSIRFSFGRFTTQQEVDRAVKMMREIF
ncbi:MAG TPA: aminotransferase class V-fold PLP-dependent enzyme [Gammaproteobacteria bacterium]|nr:aminotransferase class V-fold PLP-dependent enzyme [Gammaproteobacteria bacterium]